ncbi:MAG: nitrogen regulation protein NR(II) [Planctomycetota bacterium]
MGPLDFEKLFHSLLRKLGSEVIVIDSEGTVVHLVRRGANKQTAPGVVGRKLLEVFPNLGTSGQIDWRLEIFSHVLKEGRELEIRRQPRQVGGVTRWFDIHLYPLREEGEDGREGAITGAVLVSLDVSERTALEEELVRQARTQSLANLGASIAHEIRNPLNAMALNIQLVKETVAGSAPGATPPLDLILDEIRRIDSIVAQFLQFARPPRTALRLDNPNRAVQTVHDMIREMARKKGVELSLDCAAVPEVPMDKDRLVEAVYNLAQNAVQVLDQGGQVILRTRTEKDAVCIEVTDNGPGIPEEIREKIFELYFSTKEEGHGTGLGLPYADSIVKAHNGTLTVSSQVGHGSTFTIRLPRGIMTGRHDKTEDPHP